MLSEGWPPRGAFEMKKGFCSVVSGVILMASIAVGGQARTSSNSVERVKKEKVQIVAAQKKGPDKSGNSDESQKARVPVSQTKD